VVWHAVEPCGGLAGRARVEVGLVFWGGFPLAEHLFQRVDKLVVFMVELYVNVVGILDIPLFAADESLQHFAKARRFGAAAEEELDLSAHWTRDRPLNM
jgi:hypothetical protein